MTPNRFRTLLNQNGMDQRGFASFVGWDDRLVRRWGAGSTLIPDEVATWLEAFCVVLKAQPDWDGEWSKRKVGLPDPSGSRLKQQAQPS